jgi:transposase
MTEAPVEFARQIEQARRDLDTLGRRIREIAETAYSSDRTVAATVGAHGELRELALDPRIYRTTNAAALATTIRDTIACAADAATASLFGLVRPLLPDDLPASSLGDIELSDLFELPGQVNR